MIQNQSFQIIDFVRDGIRVGCLRYGDNVLNHTHVENPGTHLVRVREGCKKKIITKWNKIEVKRWPSMSQLLLDNSLKDYREKISKASIVPEECQGFMPKFTKYEDLINGSKVYGDMAQTAHDESYTNIGQLAYPPVYECRLREIFTDPGSDCICFICGRPLQERLSSTLGTSLGLDLTDAYDAKETFPKWQVKKIQEHHRVKLIDHVNGEHPNTPFHYLVPWTFTMTFNNQVYSSALLKHHALHSAYVQILLKMDADVYFLTGSSVKM